MKLNQNGFGLVEGLLIAVIVLLLGFGGYYVWNENQEEDMTSSSQESTKDNSMQSGDSQPEQADATPEGWTNYENSQYGFSFSYPEEWGSVIDGRFHDGENYFAKTFSNNEYLIFGAPIQEYESPGRGGVLTDPIGFIERDGEFYFEYLGGAESLAQGSGEEFPKPYVYVNDTRQGIISSDRTFFGPGNNVRHAIFNLNGDLSAVNFEVYDTAQVSEEVFIQLVETVELN